MRDFIERWDFSDVSGRRLLDAIRTTYAFCSDDEIREALGSVARGASSLASHAAAAALCELEGIGDPLATASRLYNESESQMTEPQWFVWIAGYSYNWICNGGLSSCYGDFGDRQFADRIRVYEAIGAIHAASVFHEADRAFGQAGPPLRADQRAAAWTDEIRGKLAALNPRFWACGDEIFTRVFLYSLEHADDFRRR